MPEISKEDKFLFDLQGFLQLREVLSSTECENYLHVLEQLKQREYKDEWMENIPADRRMYCNETCSRGAEGRVRFNGILRLDPAFDGLIAHPRIMPYLEEFMDGPQLINTWSIEKSRGSDAIGWHRGVSPADYSCRDGAVRTKMLNVIYFLTENGVEDGCAAAVPGSHKNNLELKYSNYKNLEMPGSVAVTGKAGDVFLFSEAVLHYGLPKTSDGLRSNLYFNYGAHDFNVMNFDPVNNHHYCLPPSIRERFTPEQKAATQWMEWAHSWTA